MRTARIVVLGVAIATSASCRNVLGIDDREVAARTCGPLTVAAGPCETCLQASCCAESAACAADESCAAVLRCEADCTDDACSARCDTSRRFTAARASFVGCRVSACATQCEVRCGDAVPGTEQCRTCVSARCCAVAAACQRGTACNDVRVCEESCGSDPSCRGACANANAEGASGLFAVRECVAAACSSACANWSCARIQPPKTGDAQIAVRLRVRDAITRGPIVGAVVRGCSDLAPDCGPPPPFGETKTDADGQATLLVKPNPTAGNYPGFIEVLGSEHKALVFFQPPLIGGESGNGLDLPSAASIAGISIASGVTIDSSRGLVLLLLRDCNDSPGAGASIKSDRDDPTTRTFYFDGSSPSVKAKSSDATGIVGFINAAPGKHDVTVTVAGKTVATTRFLVRAGYVTFSTMRGGFY